MRAEWVVDADRFAELEPAWEKLAEPQRSPFLRHAWLSAWWKAFGGTRRLRVCTLWDNGELAGALPLYQARGHLAPTTNAHSNAFEPLARDERSLSELIRTVLAASPQLRLDLVPEDSPLFDPLVQVFTANKHLLLRVPGPASPTVDTTGSLDAYWQGRSKNARKDFRRRRKRLAGLPAVEQRILVEPENLDSELMRGLAVEGSGWKSRRGTAILDAPETTHFYREVATRFAELDKLRFSTISIDGDVAAFAFNLLDHGKIWCLKSGYSPVFAPFSPGKLLMLAQIERCFELDLSSFEFLGWADPWKSMFTQETRRHWTIGAYEKRPLPLVDYGLQRFVRPRARRGYRWLKRRRGLR